MARKLSELEVRRIAEEAEIIVCGYAFTALEDRSADRMKGM